MFNNSDILPKHSISIVSQYYLEFRLTRKYAAEAAKSFLVVLAFLTLGGCAATEVTTHVVGNRPPLCQAQAVSQTAMILWGTAWRDNQKEVALRDEMASRAIAQYFNTCPCFSRVEVLKLAAGREAVGLSDVEALKFAMSTGGEYGKVILLRVEELGPLVVIYPSPVLWEGGTEVVLRVRVLDARLSTLESDITIHWKDSGAFVLKGTKTLERDLQAALASVFGETTRSANR
jgi:hypothetical protein